MQYLVELNTVEEWELFKNSESYKNNIIIFKYSPTCHTSIFMERLFIKWFNSIKDSGSLCCVRVNVLASRVLSRHIAEECSVNHESPQVLILKNGTLHTHNSHHGIMDIINSVKF